MHRVNDRPGICTAAAVAVSYGVTIMDCCGNVPDDQYTRGPFHHATQVTCKQLVGVYLSVWARKRIARHIRGVQATTAATGFGGYLGNKGAVAVRMRVYDAALVVVCSHLASGDQDGDEQKRNNDVAEIMRRCTFASTDPLAGMLVGGMSGVCMQHLLLACMCSQVLCPAWYVQLHSLLVLFTASKHTHQCMGHVR